MITHDTHASLSSSPFCKLAGMHTARHHRAACSKLDRKLSKREKRKGISCRPYHKWIQPVRGKSPRRAHIAGGLAPVGGSCRRCGGIGRSAVEMPWMHLRPAKQGYAYISLMCMRMPIARAPSHDRFSTHHRPATQQPSIRTQSAQPLIHTNLSAGDEAACTCKFRPCRCNRAEGIVHMLYLSIAGLYHNILFY